LGTFKSDCEEVKALAKWFDVKLRPDEIHGIYGMVKQLDTDAGYKSKEKWSRPDCWSFSILALKNGAFRVLIALISPPVQPVPCSYVPSCTLIPKVCLVHARLELHKRLVPTPEIVACTLYLPRIVNLEAHWGL